MDEKRRGSVITSGGLDRLRSIGVERPTSKVFEKQKDDYVGWVCEFKLLGEYELGRLMCTKVSSFNQDGLKNDRIKWRNE